MSKILNLITIISLLLLVYIHKVRAEIGTTTDDNTTINATESEDTEQHSLENMPSFSNTTHASTSTVSNEPVPASNKLLSSTEENGETGFSLSTTARKQTNESISDTSTSRDNSSDFETVRETGDDSNATRTASVEAVSNTILSSSYSEDFSTATLNNDDSNTTKTTTVVDSETASNITLSDDSSTPEDDYGTVIESDEEDKTTTTTTFFGGTVTEVDNITLINGTQTNATKGSPRQQLSKNAISDIAYYLRAYKFNEYDRRYETKPDAAPRRYFKEFPRPPLRSLHWEVRRYCESSFSECVDYLRKKIRYVSLKRVDDTAVAMQEQNWTFANHSDQIKQVDQECQKLKRIGNIIAEPFEGPLERYQWRVTASYYMCWYTMQQVPELKHLSDRCDNFADCLDEKVGPNNKDVRANDSLPYACALYSFCPDPCCTAKHLTRADTCWNSNENPCFVGNPPGARECAVNGTSNTEFRDIVLNRWNVTCRCPSGHEWNSRFGMCVDVDECGMGSHNCDRKLQQGCVNLVGSFRCACVWGHVWSSTKKECTESEALNLIKLSHKKDTADSGEESQSLIRRLTKFFRRSSAGISHSNQMALFVSLLCVLLCLF